MSEFGEKPGMPPQPDPGAPPVPGAAPAGPTKDECTQGLLIHLLGLIAAVMSSGLLGFVGPMILWLMKKDESAFLNDQGKEAMNFQLTMLIGAVIAWVITVVTCGFGFFVIFIPVVLQIVFPILAMIAANKGEYYRYPVTIRMIS